MAEIVNSETGKAHLVRVAAVGDIHCSKHSDSLLTPLFCEIQKTADIALFCGDLTDFGTLEEAKLFVKRFSETLRLPAVAVLGNHDYESGKADEISCVLEDAGIQVLNGGVFETLGIGFAGVKGFAGGFGSRELQPWGEAGIKHFVQESVEEALKLEAALSRLESPEKIAVLHYAPIEETVRGEPPEIYPFLGSSRLEEALNRYNVTAAFHGHAHFGSLEGRTMKGIPVYNVAMPLLKRKIPDKPPFKILDVLVKEVQETP